jgi:drug/metabolite transporter (DMT)-like permease
LAISDIGARMTPETRGILAIVVTMLLFTCMDACAKYLLERNPTVMVVWARFASQMALVLTISAPMLRTYLRTARPGLQLGRSVLHAVATGMFFLSLNFMALAETVAVFEVAPLLITLLAALVLGERVGPRRWTGVVIGLCGALVIIRPGLDVFQPAALLPFGAAICMAGFQIITRLIGTADAMRTTMIYSGVVGLAATSAMLPWWWQMPSTADALMMASFGWIGYFGHLTLVYALGQAPASTLAPYNYCGFLWAILMGLIVFAELPDEPTLIGAAIILGAGIYVWHRERVHARRGAASLPRSVPKPVPGR